MMPVILAQAMKRAGRMAAEGDAQSSTALQTASQLREHARESGAQLRRHVNAVSFTVCLLCLALGIAVAAAIDDDGVSVLVLAGAVLLGLLALFAIKIARQWERAIVLRFGKFMGLRGPGLFAIVPIVETVANLVDQRVRVTDVSAESALTRDTVPVNVDAIVFWTVWDAQKAILEVADYIDAVTLSAQTALR
jgi:hypothetical protein